MSPSDFFIYDADPRVNENGHTMHWLTCIESYKEKFSRKRIICRWYLYYSEEETVAYRHLDSNKIIVGFRGTHASKDIHDDALLSYGHVYPRVTEAIQFVGSLDKNFSFELTGHSLGGAIARDVSKALGHPAITFNAASPPSQPQTSSDNETGYHIVFDIISAWQSPNVIRIDKGFKPYTNPIAFVTPYTWAWNAYRYMAPSHALSNFSKHLPGTVVTSEEENKVFKNWYSSLPTSKRLAINTLLLGNLYNLPDIS